MLKWLLLVISFIGVHSFAIEDGISTNLSAKVSLDKEGFFYLSDGTCWRVIKFQKRQRSMSEWWNAVSLEVPKTYELYPKDWDLGVRIEVYPKADYLDLVENSASNQEQLSQCTHLLINPETNNILFGIPLDRENFLEVIYTTGFANGYGVGFGTGYNNG